MKKKIFPALAASLGTFGFAQAGDTAPAQLTADAEQAVLTALDDEYKAYSFYEAVMEKFGEVRPFSNIIRAEERHAEALIAILEGRGRPVPANPYASGSTPLPAIPDSLQATCAAGVEAEIENAALYDDDLLPRVASYPEIHAVMVNLRDASQYRHLPAFERCASGGGGMGGGKGGRGGRGMGMGGGRN